MISSRLTNLPRRGPGGSAGPSECVPYGPIFHRESVRTGLCPRRTVLVGLFLKAWESRPMQAALILPYGPHWSCDLQTIYRRSPLYAAWSSGSLRTRIRVRLTPTHKLGRHHEIPYLSYFTGDGFRRIVGGNGWWQGVYRFHHQRKLRIYDSRTNFDTRGAAPC